MARLWCLFVCALIAAGCSDPSQVTVSFPRRWAAYSTAMHAEVFPYQPGWEVGIGASPEDKATLHLRWTLVRGDGSLVAQELKPIAERNTWRPLVHEPGEYAYRAEAIDGDGRVAGSAHGWTAVNVGIKALGVKCTNRASSCEGPSVMMPSIVPAGPPRLLVASCCAASGTLLVEDQAGRILFSQATPAEGGWHKIDVEGLDVTPWLGQRLGIRFEATALPTTMDWQAFLLFHVEGTEPWPGG